MGYNTDFSGEFTITPPLTPERVVYLQRFNETRRVARDFAKTAMRPDGVRALVGLPVGPEGAYFVGMSGVSWTTNEPDVLDYNRPPAGQPSLWCQWRPSNSGAVLAWDEGEKFYEYIAWLEYLIKHFFSRWGHVLNGDVEWTGESVDDRGCIRVRGNRGATAVGRLVYEFDDPNFL